MEDQVKQTVRHLNIAYILFWTIPAFLMGLGELEVLPVGMWAENTRIVYVFETVDILLTALFVPLSLKLFGRALKRMDKLSLPEALKQYERWSYIRLGMLQAVVIFSALGYYLLLCNTGNLCMLIGLAASLFCLPGEKRLRNELCITTDSE